MSMRSLRVFGADMVGWLGTAYPWVKAAHLVFVIFWMAGLFMLPRYLVYHQEDGLSGLQADRWIEREAKLRSMMLGICRRFIGLSWLGSQLFQAVGARPGGIIGAIAAPAERGSGRFGGRDCCFGDRAALLIVAILIMIGVCLT